MTNKSLNVICILWKRSYDDLEAHLCFPPGVWSSSVPVTQRWCCRLFLSCSAHTHTSTHRSPTWTIQPVSFMRPKPSKRTQTSLLNQPQQLQPERAEPQVSTMCRLSLFCICSLKPSLLMWPVRAVWPQHALLYLVCLGQVSIPQSAVSSIKKEKKKHTSCNQDRKVNPFSNQN